MYMFMKAFVDSASRSQTSISYMFIVIVFCFLLVGYL